MQYQLRIFFIFRVYAEPVHEVDADGNLVVGSDGYHVKAYFKKEIYKKMKKGVALDPGAPTIIRDAFVDIHDYTETHLNKKKNNGITWPSDMTKAKGYGEDYGYTVTANRYNWKNEFTKFEVINSEIKANRPVILTVELDKDDDNNLENGATFHYLVIEATDKSMRRKKKFGKWKKWRNRSVKYYVNLLWAEHNNIWIYTRNKGSNGGIETQGSFSAFTMNIGDGSLDSYTDYEKMINFIGANQWTINDGEYTFSYGKTAGECKMTATLTGSSSFDMVGNVPNDYFVGADAERIKMGVKLSFPTDQHPWNGYCGNVQISFADGSNSWFD